jgi:hypothetical protein
MVNELCYQYSLATQVDGWKKFMKKIPSYNGLLYSLKPIRLSTWLTDEEINELLLKNIPNESKS